MNPRLLSISEIATILDGKDLSRSNIIHSHQETYTATDRALEDIKDVWEDFFYDGRGATYEPDACTRIQGVLVAGTLVLAILDTEAVRPRETLTLWGVDPASPDLITERYLDSAHLEPLSHPGALLYALACLEAHNEALSLDIAAGPASAASPSTNRV